MDYFWIGLGGIIGAVCRYFIGKLFVLALGPSFPYGTLFINITGSMLLGLIQVLALERPVFSPRFRLFSGVGFCGAYTTFSTFSKESIDLLQKLPVAGLLYVCESVLFCLIGAWLGMVVGRLILAAHETAESTLNSGD